MASNDSAASASNDSICEIYCSHCMKNVPKSTFYRHRNRFFDPVSGLWNRDSAKVAEQAPDVDPPEPMELDGSQQPVDPAAHDSKYLVCFI